VRSPALSRRLGVADRGEQWVGKANLLFFQFDHGGTQRFIQVGRRRIRIAAGLLEQRRRRAGRAAATSSSARVRPGSPARR
jgi:hypothetical protein